MSELTRRYVVMAMATEAPFDPHDHEGVFVLKPWKDPAALRALIAYRDNCYPELGRDLDGWIRVIETGPPVRGDVGRRNEPHVRPAPTRAPRRARTRAGAHPPKARRKAAPSRPRKKRRR